MCKKNQHSNLQVIMFWHDGDFVSINAKYCAFQIGQISLSNFYNIAGNKCMSFLIWSLLETFCWHWNQKIKNNGMLLLLLIWYFVDKYMYTVVHSPLHCFSLYTAEDLWAKPWAEIPRTDLETFTKVSSQPASYMYEDVKDCVTSPKCVCIWSYCSVHKGKNVRMFLKCLN